MSLSGESIYDTTCGPIPGESAFRTTATRNELFVHVFDWPSAPLQVQGVTPKVLFVQLLANGQAVPFLQSEAGLQLNLP